MSGRNKHAFFTKLFPFAKIRNIFKRHKNSTPWILEDPFEKGSKMDLVSWIFGNRDYDQDTKIYIDPENAERSISANEARATVRKFVAGWKAVGLKPGDCVCVHAFNDMMYTMLFLGIIGAGGRFTGSNPGYTYTELRHHMQSTRARFLITEYELLPVVAQVGEYGVPASNVFALETNSHYVTKSYCNSIQELLAHGERDWVRFSSEEEAKNTTAALLSTSGTTGLPKAAMISHHSFVMQSIMLEDGKEKPYKVSRLISLPEFHAFAFPLAHIAPLREGIPTYIMRRFEQQRYLSIIHQYEITETPLVPAILNALMKGEATTRELLASLRLVWCAGSPLDERAQDAFFRLLAPAARVVQVWGMTESGWITTFLWPDTDHTGSVGKLLPGMEAKLVAQNGSIVDRDEEQAEIYVRGPLVMQGYLGNHEASRAMIDVEGWLKTGDIGYRDGGKYYIVDRIKEMIKVRGWQVSPAELQAVLMLHPDILDAAVIGILHPKDDTTEAPRAYVVKIPDSEVDLADIKNHMSNYLARYKSLDGGVVFVDAIPKNPAGKILRKALKDRANFELQSARTTSKLAQSWRLFIKATGLLYEHWQAMSTPMSSPAATTDSGNNESSLLASPTTASSIYSDTEGETDCGSKSHEQGHGIILHPRDFDHRSRVLAPVDTWLLGIKIPGSFGPNSLTVAGGEACT
ncbi:MAG: hypothetical protein ASARMPREDX12_008723 [Alectoria sarmentosa]|nr:MAG: hypothetical protein ASARMPREDX12_008723 [Alectoria sarmentosa]